MSGPTRLRFSPSGPFSPGGDIMPTLAQVLEAGNDADGLEITGLPLPTEPTEAANKEYVDNAATPLVGFYLVELVDPSSGALNLTAIIPQPEFEVIAPGNSVQVPPGRYKASYFGTAQFDNTGSSPFLYVASIAMANGLGPPLSFTQQANNYNEAPSNVNEFPFNVGPAVADFTEDQYFLSVQISIANNYDLSSITGYLLVERIGPLP